MSNIRIRRLYLAEFQQFRDTMLDFRGPDGAASPRVCFIGRNGTGKSTVLRLLWEVLRGINGFGAYKFSLGVEYENDEGVHVWATSTERTCSYGVNEVGPNFDLRGFVSKLQQRETPEPPWRRQTNVRLGDLRVFSPSEAHQNVGLTLSGMPGTSLDAALKLNQATHSDHLISSETLAQMWTRLIWRIQQREDARQSYENADENLDKTKRQLVEEFNAAHPDVLVTLAALWNRILEPAGLEFDFEGARTPSQLTENLEAYVRRRDTGQKVPYNALSTGIRDFIFRLGHLFLLYFEQPIQAGFVLVDEPENSLFPDFLFDLVETYDQIVGENTQLFMATHSPIVAAQFEPWQRIILDWDDDAFVTARQGSAPVGDDPNAVLESDFGLESLLGPRGREKYDEYLELRKRIRHASDDDKPALVHEAAMLGTKYGFT